MPKKQQPSASDFNENEIDEKNSNPEIPIQMEEIIETDTVLALTKLTLRLLR